MRIEKSWGYEEIIENGSYCCKKLVYTRPCSSSRHYHERKHETFVVATGEFRVLAGSGDFSSLLLYYAGDYLVLPPRTVHQIECIRPGFIVEASSHDDPNDCVRLIPSDP